MRSKLFVPGSRPELFPKALASGADAISIDLEDAVTQERKAEARERVRAWLTGRLRDGDETRTTVIVRVNAMESAHFADDVAAVVQPGLHVVNLPKPQSPAAVRAAAAAIAAAERVNEVVEPVGLLLNIETPRALREAAALAAADPRVVGLQLGLGDLFEPFGIDRAESAAVSQAMFAVRMAAAEAGVPAYDGAFANVADTEGYRAEAALARRMGLAGKSCIHPSQVALANEAFRPSDAQIAHALAIEAARADALARGLGAYMVNGRMVDAPFERSALTLLRTARGLGLLPADANGS